MKIQYHLLYMVLIIVIIATLCDRHTKTEYKTVVKVDTVRSVVTRFKSDTVYRYQTDTISLVDSLRLRDTVYILKDWATPKVFVNEYADSNYTLTVTDSINFNKLITQRVQIKTYNKTRYVNKSELWAIYQTPLTPSILYRHKSGIAVSGGYDVLNGAAVFGVGIRIK